MFRKIFVGLVFAAGLLAAQPAPLQFEVASVRPSAPLTPATAGNVGLYIDKNQFRAGTLALRDYISLAYQMRPYQVETPDWMASARFDINATMPPQATGVTADGPQLAQMMRALLEDRFQVKSHRITKEFAVYALVQAKDGIKAKESPLDAASESLTVGAGATKGGSQVSLGRGSTLSITANRIEGLKLPMLTLAETLGRFLDRPVLDKTELTSAYDIALDLAPEDFQALMIRATMAAGVSLPPQATKILDTASGDSLHEALAKVGLKLESRKQSMDVLVIDSATRQPTEN